MEACVGRMLRWAGIGFGALLLLAVLFVLVAPYVVNLERYRSLLAARASRALGREVTLGALRVSVWSGLGAEAKGIRVAAAPGSGPEPFLTADELRVRVQLLPLLKRQIKISTATVDRPRIRLVRTPAGRWNVEDLFKPSPPPVAPRPAPETARPSKPPLLGGALLSEVQVTKGEVTLLDQAGKPPLTVKLADVDLTLRQTTLSDPIQVRARAELGEDDGRLEISGRLIPNTDAITLDLAVTARDVAASLVQALLLGPDSGVHVAGRLSADARVSGTPAAAAVTGVLDLTPLDLRVAGVAKPSGEEGRLAFTAHRQDAGLRVPRLSLSLGDLTLEGSLQIPDLKAPRVIFDASTSRLDLDRLLAPRRETTWLGPGPAYAAPTPSRQATPGVPMQGRLRIGDLRYGGVTWSRVDAALHYQGGVLRLPSLNARFMQGRMAASGQADFRPGQPLVALKTRLTDVATEPIVKALIAGPWTLQSRLTGTTDVSFTGLSGKAILGSAAGSGALQFTNGHLVGYKPLERLAETVEPMLAAQGVRTRLTDFQQVKGTFTLDKGVLRTKDLTLTKPEGTVLAAGSLGLLDSAVDFDVSVRLGRTSVEAKVTGTTSQPVVVPKLDRLQQRLEREVDKVLPGQRGRTLKDLFRGLFGK
jgi:AsmA protein